MERDFDYRAAGFDAFLSRSIDDLSQINLESPGSQTRAIRYDDQQVSGTLGDTVKVGGVSITLKGIEFNDGEEDRFLMGFK